jgi:initiation factor 1A
MSGSKSTKKAKRNKGKPRPEKKIEDVDVDKGTGFYAEVKKIIGGNRVRVLLNTGEESEAIIPGKFRKRVWLREGTKVLLNSGYEVIQVIRDSDSVANDAAKAISKVTKDSNGGIVCFQNFSDDEEEDDLIINNLTINRQKVSHKGLDRKFTDPDELAATIVKESNEEIDGEIDFDDI